MIGKQHWLSRAGWSASAAALNDEELCFVTIDDAAITFTAMREAAIALRT